MIFLKNFRKNCLGSNFFFENFAVEFLKKNGTAGAKVFENNLFVENAQKIIIFYEKFWTYDEKSQRDHWKKYSFFGFRGRPSGYATDEIENVIYPSSHGKGLLLKTVRQKTTAKCCR